VPLQVFIIGIDMSSEMKEGKRKKLTMGMGLSLVCHILSTTANPY